MFVRNLKADLFLVYFLHSHNKNNMFKQTLIISFLYCSTAFAGEINDDNLRGKIVEYSDNSIDTCTQFVSAPNKAPYKYRKVFSDLKAIIQASIDSTEILKQTKFTPEQKTAFIKIECSGLLTESNHLLSYNEQYYKMFSGNVELINTIIQLKPEDITLKTVGQAERFFKAIEPMLKAWDKNNYIVKFCSSSNDAVAKIRSNLPKAKQIIAKAKAILTKNSTVNLANADKWAKESYYGTMDEELVSPDSLVVISAMRSNCDQSILYVWKYSSLNRMGVRLRGVASTSVDKIDGFTSTETRNPRTSCYEQDLYDAFYAEGWRELRKQYSK